MFSPEARADYMRDLAAQQGRLVVISRQEADNWRQEWHRILRVVGRSYQTMERRPPPVLLRAASRKGRGKTLPPTMAVPGTWLLFRPHASTPVPPHLYRVVAVVPAGIPLVDVLPPDHLAQLDRHTILGATPRCARVLVVQMGQRRLEGCLKAILAGELASRATVLTQPPRVLECGRLPEPLSPEMFVGWDWHSRHGAAHLQGLVVGYVPADVPIEKALPAFRMTWGLRSVSSEDRYVVMALRGKKPYLSPSAHLIEQAYLQTEAMIYEAAE